MKTIETKVQVDVDRQLSIQLPDDIQVGEYDAVLVINSRSNQEEALEPHNSESGQSDKVIAERWRKWFDEVDQLPIKENSAGKNFHQHLVEKYRKQGLNL